MFQIRKRMPILLTVVPVCLLVVMVRAPHKNPFCRFLAQH